MPQVPNPKNPPTVLCPVCGLELPAQLKKCPQDGVSLTTQLPSDPLVGTVIGGRYEILSLIGRGGMSMVYKARNRAVGSIVAVKTLKQDLVSDEELFARFCQEAKAVQMLIHPNIITVHEFGVTLSGQPFIVMDYLEGKTLADVIEESGRLSVKRTLRIFIRVCDALAQAHAHKIIHRDIKPGNIMLVQTANDTDVVKLFDFGFAKLLPSRGMQAQALTQQGDVLGTPLYMSPEQSRGKQLDSRSDIYSVGCVMYETLTGKAPIVGENVLDTMQRHISETPAALETARPDLYIPEALTTVLFRTLEKNPVERYQSAADLRRDLEIIYNGLSGKAVKQGDLPGLAKLKQMPESKPPALPGAIILLSLFGLVTVGAVWTYLAMGHPPLAFTAPPGLNAAAPDSHWSPPVLTGDPAVTWAKYRQLGLQAASQFRYTEADDLLSLALAQARKTADSENKAALTYLDIAHLYLQEKKLSDAEKAAERAMSLRFKLNEMNERPMADIYCCLGEVCLAREDYRKAQTYFEKGLAIQQRDLGPMHEDVAGTLNELGRVAEAQQNPRRAEAYYKQALAIREAALGPDNPAVAQTLTDYARLLKRLNKDAEAARAEQRARAIHAAAR